jgi:Zn-dependent peptidase ImmA (M78 family)
MLPENVVVAGITYKVQEKEYVEINDNANALGCCTYDKALIEVKSTMSNERKEEVFMHELFHAILFESGYDDHDEEMVNRASKVFYQVVKDNPNLLNKIE